MNIMINGKKFYEALENIFEIDFSSKYKNTLIKIPNQILYVCSFSCKFNKNLKKLYCNSNLIGIGEGAFYSCNNLQEIYLNDKLLFIGDKMFYNCSINNIVVPEGVEKMGYYVFNSGNVFCNFESKLIGWDEKFYTRTAKVYYKGQWNYDDESNLYVINKNI